MKDSINLLNLFSYLMLAVIFYSLWLGTDTGTYLLFPMLISFTTARALKGISDRLDKIEEAAKSDGGDKLPYESASDEAQSSSA